MRKACACVAFPARAPPKALIRSGDGGADEGQPLAAPEAGGAPHLGTLGSVRASARLRF